MIRRLLPILAASLLLSASPVKTIKDFDNTVGATGSGDVLAFVGTQIATVEDKRDDGGWSYDPITGDEFITMDSGWRSRFAIKEIIAGNYDGPRIDFIAYDHYGQPAYSRAESAVLLYLHDFDEGWHHDKYNYVPVYRTMNGDWASCSSPFRSREKRHPSDKDAPPLRRIDFASPVTFDLSELYDTVERFEAEYDETFSELPEAEQQELLAEFAERNAELDKEFGSDAFTREGDIATCHMGRLVKGIVAHELQTRFRYRAVEDHCEAQFPEVDRRADDSKSRRDERRASIDACFETLYPAGWPYTEQP